MLPKICRYSAMTNYMTISLQPHRPQGSHPVFSFIERFSQLICLGFLVLFLAACGGGGSGGGLSDPGVNEVPPTPTPVEPLSITSDTPLEATQGQDYQYQLTAQGGSGKYYWSLVGSTSKLPPGLSLDPTLGLIGGLPTAAGTYPFTVQVEDTEDTELQPVTQSLSISVAVQPVTPLSITSDTPLEATQGQDYQYQLTAQGGSGNYYWSLVGSTSKLPPGLSLDPTLGLIGGLPTAAGTYPFTVQVQDTKDTELQPVTKSLSISVAPQPVTPLSITSDTLPAATQGQDYQYQLTAQGGSGNYYWSLVGSTSKLPPGLSLDPTLGLIGGLPTAAGTYPFTVQVKDTKDTELQPVTKSLSINVAPQPVKVKDVQLLVTSPQLPSSGDNPLLLTAVVRDSSNNTIEGATVSFKADNNGTLQVIRPTTDAAGTAAALLTTQGDPQNRQIKVTASAGSVQSSVVVNVVGTVISIAGPESISLGQKGIFTFSVLNSAGIGAANQSLEISSKNNNYISNPTPVTDSNGRAEVQIQGSSIGNDVITVRGAGAVAQQPLTVLPGTFVFVNPSPNTQVNVNKPLAITVEWKQAGFPVAGQSIAFNATRGTLPATAVTDANGRATVNIQSNTAGPSIITATTPSGISIQIEVLFVATQPFSLYLQVNPKIMGPFQQSTVKVLVFDPNGNPVTGIKIFFNLQDSTGGSLSNPFAVTNNGGEANITYNSAATISGYNEVKITATVDGTSLQRTTTLTVAEKTVFIRFGTGNEIEQLDTTSYAAPYRVWLTDTAGNPVADATVRLGVVPIAYRKGYYIPPGENQSCWSQIVTAGWCNNEDTNRNGRLDIPPDVDENNNGRLEPGNVASVARQVITGADGSAFFTVNYGKNYAYWVDVELTGSTTVAGSESSETISFILQGVVPDFCKPDTSPPGNPSPFGIANSCANPN